MLVLLLLLLFAVSSFLGFRRSFSAADAGVLLLSLEDVCFGGADDCVFGVAWGLEVSLDCVG